MANTILESVVDFDILELEEIESFEVPLPGHYQFEGVSFYSEQAEPKEGQTEGTIFAVVKLNLTSVVEYTNKDGKEMEFPKELIMKAPLTNLTDAFYEKKMQTNVKLITRAVGEFFNLIGANGKLNSSAVAEKFSGVVGGLIIANDTWTDKETKEKRVSWSVKDCIIS